MRCLAVLVAAAVLLTVAAAHEDAGHMEGPGRQLQGAGKPGSVFMVEGLTVHRDTAMDGTYSDIPCGQFSFDGKQQVRFCRVCGRSWRDVCKRCVQTAGCVAFDMETAQCGYLKNGKLPLKPHKGINAWRLATKGPKCGKTPL